MIAVLIVFVMIIVYIGTSISQSWHDQNNTFQSQDIAKANGKLTYTKYSKNGQIRQRVWMPTGQKGYVNGQKQFIGTNGKVIADIGQMQIERANKVSKMMAEQKGWNFYPYFVTLQKEPFGLYYSQGMLCWPCIEMNTNRTFTWIGLSGNRYVKKYCKIDEKGFTYSEKKYDFGETIQKQESRPSQFIKEINEVATTARQEGMWLTV